MLKFKVIQILINHTFATNVFYNKQQVVKSFNFISKLEYLKCFIDENIENYRISSMFIMHLVLG